ncbi:MMPL family transporter [Treponema bryantii]|uniref:MMPL family transporter n=1 Tax=Treponema bryantii TaxID=163 RepID=UPI0003B5AFCF|nr:MMPL family transporter [Treponema bryantii]
MNRLINISQKKLLGAWIIYHSLILAFFIFSLIFFHGKISIDSDLFNLVPKSISKASVKKADEKMMAVTSQNVFVLVASEDFAQAKQVAEAVYDRLKDSHNFESLSLYNDVSSMGEITDFLYKYRSFLIDEKTADKILTNPEGAQDFAMEALSKAYGGFTMLPLDNLDSDPFLLTEHHLQNYLTAVQNAGTAMSVKDGVLASKFEGKWYVMIRGVLSREGAKLASKNNAITEIYSATAEFPDATFVYSGTPFHSHESSNSASREISIIASLSMLAVIILLIFIFRSLQPLAYSVGSILISLGVAVLATLAVFHKMHVITLVFGTSLIGSCIDYSLHFFTHWSANTELKSGIEIRNHIFSGLLMAIISTGICFAILLFAPFAILKQMSFFCLTGLVSSFLTTIAVYPYIKLPTQRGKVRFTKGFAKVIRRLEQKWVGRSVIIGLFLFALISILICHKNVKIKNNLLTLYDMKGRLLQDEITASQVIQYTPGGWYIVSGETEDQALANEEALRHKFEEMTGGQIGYVSTSSFVPSQAVQKKSRQAYKKLMENAGDQLLNLGFDEAETSAALKNLMEDYEESGKTFVSFENGNIPSFIESAISSAWLGQVDGKYFTVMLPTKVTDYTNYRSLAEQDDNVYFISKSQDISADLDSLTIMIFKFFIIAYILMFIMLRFFYSWKQALKIISVPFLIILIVVAVFAICKINMEFFSVTGLILVFGLGLDYIIYMMENEKRTVVECSRSERIETTMSNETTASQNETTILEPFATMVSFVTTIISFGALALSSFKPVHLIGLSIFIGLATAYISSFFYGRNHK